MYQSVENQVAKECLIDQLTSAVDGTHSSRKRRVMFLVWSLAAFKLHQTYVCHGFSMFTLLKNVIVLCIT